MDDAIEKEGHLTKLVNFRTGEEMGTGEREENERLHEGGRTPPLILSYWDFPSLLFR